MTVDEIISLISTLGAGQENPTPEDRKVYLKFLNLAYFELFGNTFANNPRIKFKEETIVVSDGINEDFAEKAIKIQDVWLIDSNFPLEMGDVDQIKKCDPGLKESGKPRFWFLFNNNLNTYPKQAGNLNLGVRYIPNVSELTLETLESEIPIPTLYHTGLVDGACYYLFQDEGAFKDGVKMNESMERWKKYKSKLACYFANTFKKKNYSTFQKV